MPWEATLAPGEEVLSVRGRRRRRAPDWPPDAFVLAHGEAKPAGSKSSGVATRLDPATGQRVPVKRDGRLVTFTKDSSGEKGKTWRGAVADAGGQTMSALELGPFDCPVYVEMTFVVLRPKGHLTTKGVLRPSAPCSPAKRPDVLKLARAVEDALTGVVWTDDSRIVAGYNEKAYASPAEGAHVEVRVWALPATHAEATQLTIA